AMARAGWPASNGFHLAGQLAGRRGVRTANAHGDRRFDWRAVGEAAQINAGPRILIEPRSDFLDRAHTFVAMPFVEARVDLALVGKLLGRNFVVVDLRIAASGVGETPIYLRKLAQHTLGIHDRLIGFADGAALWRFNIDQEIG